MPTTPTHPEPSRPDPIDARALFNGATRVTIIHNDRQYTLLITRSGKLILN
ncbi:hemin uptake protein HemP [Myxococcota bacterium]|nr:hemin uptake protein HemP [Myxococcota bacterium]MBU1535093.1 hemin uptake protein HemP [Myxococcota bacterium]